MDRSFRKRPFTPKKKFTDAEDAQLLELIDRLGPNDWAAIARFVPGRTPRQCRERWRHYLKPVIKSTPWTAEEDATLIREYGSLGPKWSALALFLPGRTDVNVKNRWSKLARIVPCPRTSRPKFPSQMVVPPVPPPPPPPPRAIRFPSIDQVCSGLFSMVRDVTDSDLPMRPQSK
jgi:hypothetical protein